MNKGKAGDEGAQAKRAKRKLNNPVVGGLDEDYGRVRKPGLESSHPHIALMYVGRDWDMARELTRGLTVAAAQQLGVRRRRA